MSNVHHLHFGGGENAPDGSEYAAEGLGAFVTLLMTSSDYVEHLIDTTQQ